MDGSSFDRITKLLTAINPRREAIRVLAGTGFAAVAARLGADEIEARKKRCRKIGQSCTGKRKCCRNDRAEVSCVEFVEPRTGECFGEDLRAGFRCCGQIGHPCDPNFGDREGAGFGNCSCCPPLFCGRKKKKDRFVFRCQAEDT